LSEDEFTILRDTNFPLFRGQQRRIWAKAFIEPTTTIQSLVGFHFSDDAVTAFVLSYLSDRFPELNLGIRDAELENAVLEALAEMRAQNTSFLVPRLIDEDEIQTCKNLVRRCCSAEGFSWKS